MKLVIQKNPTPYTLIERLTLPDEAAVPEGYELSTEQDAQAWVDQQIVNGWTPAEMPAPAPRIPWAISNADLRRQLVLRGINPALVLGYLNSLEEGAQKWGAIADWEYANYFERTHPMLNALAPSFGLTVEDVDEMFMACPAYPRMPT